MKFRATFLWALVLLGSTVVFAADFDYRPMDILPPPPPREFRGAWITEVAANPDWPSKPGLSVAQQKAELIALLNRAVQLKLNAVILQVRPACDAVYASPIEPWSEFLTGAQGKPPQPFYDPLAFAIEEAHKRGLELHAWINPFRASLATAQSPTAPNHISRTHPELIRRYGDELWLDPGEPAARQYVLRVVMDIVKRYDVDGVVFDDYFYPYPEKDSAGHVLNFPDTATWEKYGRPYGYGLEDWRRQNINQFIQTVYESIKAVKPWVKFGVSPFGIWRPGYPEQIKGLDAYANLYADSRKWLAEGWLDYFSPQLYWPNDSPQQSFSVLLNWWAQQNVKGRALWPSLNAAGVGSSFLANEIARQIQITRAQTGASGEIFYHLKDVEDNSALAAILQAQFKQPALVPALPWLAAAPQTAPSLEMEQSGRTGWTAKWQSRGEPPQRWVLQFRGTNGAWTTEIFPAGQTDWFFENEAPEIVSVRAVDRLGNLSPPTALKKTALPRTGKRLMILN